MSFRNLPITRRLPEIRRYPSLAIRANGNGHRLRVWRPSPHAGDCSKRAGQAYRRRRRRQPDPGYARWLDTEGDIIELLEGRFTEAEFDVRGSKKAAKGIGREGFSAPGGVAQEALQLTGALTPASIWFAALYRAAGNARTDVATYLLQALTAASAISMEELLVRLAPHLPYPPPEHSSSRSMSIAADDAFIRYASDIARSVNSPIIRQRHLIAAAVLADDPTELEVVTGLSEDVLRRLVRQSISVVLPDEFPSEWNSILGMPDESSKASRLTTGHPLSSHRLIWPEESPQTLWTRSRASRSTRTTSGSARMSRCWRRSSHAAARHCRCG